jgi:hypothetical protein
VLPTLETPAEILRAEVRRETVFADERYSQVILDILASTDMGRLTPSRLKKTPRAERDIGVGTPAAE